MTPSTSVIKTLAYFSVFNFPLTKEEIAKFSGTDFEPVNFLAVGERGGYLGLGDPSTWVDRKARGVTSLRKIDEATKLFKRISWWPYLKAVLVTGSTAASNAEEGSDVDVLVIASPNTLWLTRLTIVTFLILTKTYRNFICPNIWLSMDNLLWLDHNIHSAADAFLAKPILNKTHTYENFCLANKWAQDFWPLEVRDITDPAAKRVSAFASSLDLLLFKLEKLRRQLLNLKNTGDEVSYNRIHFRKNDSKDRILKRFEEIYKDSMTSVK